MSYYTQATGPGLRKPSIKFKGKQAVKAPIIASNGTPFISIHQGAVSFPWNFYWCFDEKQRRSRSLRPYKGTLVRGWNAVTQRENWGEFDAFCKGRISSYCSILKQIKIKSTPLIPYNWHFGNWNKSLLLKFHWTPKEIRIFKYDVFWHICTKMQRLFQNLF